MNAPVKRMIKTVWEVETSHRISHPETYCSTSLDDLRRQLQDFADAKPVGIGRPPIGQLMFRYDLDSCESAEVVHVSFMGRSGKRLRFMRLRRRD